MTSKEIIKRLENEGWYCVGGKDDHQKYKHPSKAGHVVVPHPRKDMATGTLRNIYRQTGWEWRLARFSGLLGFWEQVGRTGRVQQGQKQNRVGQYARANYTMHHNNRPHAANDPQATG